MNRKIFMLAFSHFSSFTWSSNIFLFLLNGNIPASFHSRNKFQYNFLLMTLNYSIHVFSYYAWIYLYPFYHWRDTSQLHHHYRTLSKLKDLFPLSAGNLFSTLLLEFFLFIISRNKHVVENKEWFWNDKNKFFHLINSLSKDKMSCLFSAFPLSLWKLNKIST